jgi:hypothetical protein
VELTVVVRRPDVGVEGSSAFTMMDEAPPSVLALTAAALCADVGVEGSAVTLMEKMPPSESGAADVGAKGSLMPTTSVDAVQPMGISVDIAVVGVGGIMCITGMVCWWVPSSRALFRKGGGDVEQ